MCVHVLTLIPFIIEVFFSEHEVENVKKHELVVLTWFSDFLTLSR